ncbi:mutator type transposase [Tanacetum coccineum]
MMEDDYMPKFVNDASNLHLKEYFIKEGIHFDPVQVYAGKNNMFSIKLHHGGKFTASPKRMYVGGKVNYVDNIDVDLFNVDEVHMFVQDFGYDPKQLMFYHSKLPNKSLDYGLRPLSCDADVVSLINIVETCKVVEVFIEYWLTSVDHHYLSPFKTSIEIEELDDDVELNASVVGSSKRLALEYGHKNVNAEESVCKSKKRTDSECERRTTVNVNEEQTVNVNAYTTDDNYEFNVDANLNLDDYTVCVDENMNVDVNIDENENVNVHENENVNVDENVNADDEQDSDEENEHDSSEDEQGRGDDKEDFIVDEEHVIDEVEVNMEGFTFSVEEQGDDLTVTPNVDLTDEALEVLDFDSFDSDVGDDTASIRRRNLRNLRKTGGQSCGIVNTLFVGQEFPNEELAKARIKAHVVETRRKIRIPSLKHHTMSVNANNGIYPVAHGIVESESKDSRTWFLSCLGDDFDLYANSNFTFIIDRQKGLLLALQYLFPTTEHIYCVRHIHDNMNLIYKCGHYKELLWKCGTATTVVHFERAMDEFKGYNRMAHEWLRKIPPKHWKRSKFLGRAKCDLLINNICEVFNRQLLEARDCPVITALEYVREYLMKRIVIVQKVIEKSQGPLTPTMTKIFNAINEKPSQLTVVWNGAELFQVNEGRQNQVVVNLDNRSCACRKWEVSGITCKHAVACIFNMTKNGMQVGLPEDWVYQSMRLQTWRTVYSFKINPVPGKKRKKSAGEVTEMVKNGKLTRKGGTVTCCKCGQKGHNKRSCKGPSVAGSGSASGAASVSQTPDPISEHLGTMV